jgi:hypothetical protein
MEEVEMKLYKVTLCGFIPTIDRAYVLAENAEAEDQSEEVFMKDQVKESIK